MGAWIVKGPRLECVWVGGGVGEVCAQRCEKACCGPPGASRPPPTCFPPLFLARCSRVCACGLRIHSVMGSMGLEGRVFLSVVCGGKRGRGRLGDYVWRRAQCVLGTMGVYQECLVWAGANGEREARHGVCVEAACQAARAHLPFLFSHTHTHTHTHTPTQTQTRTHTHTHASCLPLTPRLHRRSSARLRADKFGIKVSDDANFGRRNRNGYAHMETEKVGCVCMCVCVTLALLWHHPTLSCDVLVNVPCIGLLFRLYVRVCLCMCVCVCVYV